jgi:hypothetical protein
MQVISIIAVVVFTILGIVPLAYSQSSHLNTIQRLGEYKIVNIANVPHLQDKHGFFVFPAFCPTACSAAWAKGGSPAKEKNPSPETKAPVASSGNNLYVAWWTHKTGNWEVMFKASHDKGKTFGKTINLSNSPNASSTNAEVSASGNNVSVSWREKTNNGSELIMRASNDGGRTFGDIINMNNASTTEPLDNNTATTSISNTSFFNSTNATSLESFTDQYRIGAIKVEFTKPGTYSFSYFIKPLLGEFQNLASLQVITIPTNQDNGFVPLEKVSWYKYPYTTVGESIFRVDNPGTYIIGFGPAQGTALTKLEAAGVPSGFTLKYKVDPPENVKILKPDMDIYIKQMGHGISFQTIGYEDMPRNGVLSQAQQFSLDGLKEIGVSDKTANWLIMRGVSNTLLGGADLRYPLGRNADFATMRINEFLPILHTITTNGDFETAKLTTAKILTYSLTLLNESSSKGINIPGAQEQFKQAENLWIQGKYEEVLPILAKLAKEILPVVHPEWQKKPSFSIYRLDAKVADGGEELSLSGLPLTVTFPDIKQEKSVTTNAQGETVFIGPSSNFSINGIGIGNGINGGMTNMDVIMNRNSGKWLMRASTSKSQISEIQSLYKTG